MRCRKCQLCSSASLTLSGLKVYIEWTSESWLKKAEPRGASPSPTPPNAEPTSPTNLSARSGQTGPSSSAYWNQQQRQSGVSPSTDCQTWGTVAASEILDFISYPQELRRFLSSAACRSFPLWSPAGEGSPVASCSDKDVPYLLSAVKSEPGHFAARQAVRETWGSPVAGTRLLFSSGSPLGMGGPDLRSSVTWESRRYGDLSLWDFSDVPYNRTLKDSSSSTWSSHHCPDVNFVSQVQDDAFVHIPALSEHSQTSPPTWARSLYSGEIFTQAKPLRKPGGPFYVPKTFFEGDYPAYASGGGYVISGRSAPWSSQAAARVAPFPFDDVYTGFCFRASGLAPRAHPGFLTAWPAERTRDPCAVRGSLLVHPVSPQDTIWLWRHSWVPELQC